MAQLVQCFLYIPEELNLVLKHPYANQVVHACHARAEAMETESLGLVGQLVELIREFQVQCLKNMVEKQLGKKHDIDHCTLHAQMYTCIHTSVSPDACIHTHREHIYMYIHMFVCLLRCSFIFPG